MTEPDALNDYLQAAKEAARLAARELERWRPRFRVQEKGRFDLVTDADVASQQVIHDYLRARFPAHALLAEEGDAAKTRPAPDAPPTWIVDPIDGTTNYVHDFPFFCVSIGLQIANELVVGVVLDPSRQEMFHAARGMGAWVNGQRIRTSQVSSLSQALLSTGFPTDVRGQEFILDWWRNFTLKAQSVRRTGSTAMNLAYLAAGRFDGYWAFDNKVWDVAAAVVLLREAGGSITNIDGSVYDPYTPDCVASNGTLHGELLAEFLQK
jgi:myo-inositol-1(or 4)-monophosphatase